MEDFNQPSPERIDLLKRLDEAIGDVTPHFWAACQICDLNKLERFLSIPRPVLDAFCVHFDQVLHYWASSFHGVKSQSSTSETPTPQTSNLSQSPSTLSPPSKRQKTLDSPATLPQDTNAKEQAEERDSFCCVLTGIALIDVVHIYPHHAIKGIEQDEDGPRHKFWNYLEMFWPKEKVTIWKAKHFPDGISNEGQEEVYNLISLSPYPHRMWEQGLFALKPISESDDKKTLIVQFFWQTKQKDSFPTISLTIQPHSTKGLEEITGPHGGGIWLHNKNGDRIQSGDFFELNTDDPITKPLPSFEILELQWFLRRVQGMAGAAEIDEMNYWQEMDPDDSDYAVEEAPSDVEDL